MFNQTQIDPEIKIASNETMLTKTTNWRGHIITINYETNRTRIQTVHGNVIELDYCCENFQS